MAKRKNPAATFTVYLCGGFDTIHTDKDEAERAAAMLNRVYGAGSAYVIGDK